MTRRSSTHLHHARIAVVCLIVAFLLSGTPIALAENCGLSLRAAQLMKMLDDAIQDMKGGVPQKGGKHLDWHAHCSQYLRAVLRQIQVADRSLDSNWTNEDVNRGHIMRANDFWNEVPRNSAWEKVGNINDVQELANQGSLVIGIAPDHVGVAVPAPSTIDLQQMSGKGGGPFVRDGNEHPVNPATREKKPLFASTYGAVPASEAFNIHESQWYRLKSTMPPWWAKSTGADICPGS